MPVRIRVMNCQSIRDASIVVDGFTVITGPNNSGKTAYMRAVLAPFINANVSALVRHGADDLVVAMDFGDGNTLGFKKGKTKPTYKINGVGPLHPGNSVPDELEALGIYPIVASNGRDKLWPQIASQFASNQFSGPVFLLDKSGAILAEVVADVERVGKLSRALKLAEKDVRSNGSLLKTRRKDLATTQTELDTFLGLDGVITAIDSIESRWAESITLQTQLGELVVLADRFEQATHAVESLRGIGDVPVPDSSQITEAQDLASEAVALGALYDRWVGVKATVDATQGISEVAVPPESTCVEAEKAGSALQALQALATKLQAAQDEVATLQGIGKVSLPEKALLAEAAEVSEELAEVVQLSDRWDEASQEHSRWAKAGEAAESLQLDDDKMDQAAKLQKGMVVLAEMGAKLVKAKDAVADAQDELTDIEGQLEAAHMELTGLLSELDTCPTCDTPMSETHLHKEIA